MNPEGTEGETSTAESCYCEISTYWAQQLDDADCDELKVLYWYDPLARICNS